MAKKISAVFLFGILLAVILSLNLVTATIDFTGITGNNQNVNPSSQVTFSFNVQSTGLSGQFNNAKLILPNIFGSGTQWSGDIGTFLLLPNSSVSRTVSVNVPSNQVAQLYTASISMDTSSYNISGSPVVHDQSISINVNSQPSITITPKTAIETTKNGTIEVENTGNTLLSNIELTKTSGNFDLSFSTNNFDLASGAKKTVTISPINLGDVGFNGKSALIEAKASDGTKNTATLTIAGSFCKVGEVGDNLRISDVKVDNTGEGDDNDWQLLDIIEIEVQVDNDGVDDIKDVFVELGFFDSAGRNQVNDFEFDNVDDEEIDIGTIKDGKDDTVTFTFKVPADMEDGSYRLTIKAYSDDLGESNECTAISSDFSDNTFEKINIDRETDSGKFIAFENIVVSPSEATCGERVTLTADVFNIGDEDQDQVRVNLLNTVLGINDFVEIRNDLDQGDKDSVRFEFTIPQITKFDINNRYDLFLNADYDFRSNVYRESSDEDTRVLFKVIDLGCNARALGTMTSINAELDSDAIEGEQITIKANIRNLGQDTATYTIAVSANERWSSVSSIQPSTLTLIAGESRDVLIKLKTFEDSAGDQSFTIRTISNTGRIDERQVSLFIEETSSGTGPGITGTAIGDVFKGNALIWIIVLANIILIVLIIIVAVRLSRER